MKKIKRILSLSIIILLAAVYIKANIYKTPSLKDLKEDMEVLSEISTTNKIGEKKALKIVKDYLKDTNSYIPSNIEVDSEDHNYYIIHVYDIISNNGESHTATTGWYQVNKHNGELINIMQ